MFGCPPNLQPQPTASLLVSHFSALERMYVNGPINQYFKPSIHIGDGVAEVRTTVRPDMHHAAHAAHGAVYFKLLDDAAFFAAQSLVTDAFVVTVSFTVYFVAPVLDGEMVATGRIVHQSKRLFLAESTIDVNGKQVARGNGSFMRSTVRLEPRIGYVRD
jgi:uncharacterized protein (TIGR00369 family)